MSPFLAVELLSPGTEAEDLGQTLREVNQPPTKWQVYKQILRIPYYVVFDCYDYRFRAFQLMGMRYQELNLTDQALWLEDINLSLRVWSGRYQEVEGLWLRWFDAERSLIPSLEEQAEQERQRAERLAARLRELGVDPEDL